MVNNERSIYVRIDIRGPLEAVWRLTQTPELHERWDLRFSEIRYLPRADANEPQRFVYATRIGFGIRIEGYGDTVGTHVGPSGQRTSALRFASDDWKSLIRRGSGYWKYIPDETSESVRFLTRYDYEVRNGWFGRVFDRIVFRPLLGWATAWSFDRLRIWVESGISPAESMRGATAYAISRGAVAFIWIYQGVVPKLLWKHADEIAMLKAGGFSDSGARACCIWAGGGEVGIGILILLMWRARWPLWVTTAAMPAALIGVAMVSPGHLTAAFNPVVLNVSMSALAVVALVVGSGELPSARRCVRRPSDEGK